MSLFDSATLVVTPNGYKEDKLYSIKPTDGSGDLVVTRATTATRVNSAGLVELVPYNLIQQSETFNTTWTAYNGATITSNAITAPNGTTTADLLIAGATQEIYSANMPKAAEELFFTFSCYAKFYNTNVFQMVCSDFSTSGVFVNFNLSTLSVTYSTGATWSNTTASMESVGNGWYRCIFTSKSPSTTGLYLSLLTTGTNSVSGVYIWGAQVVQGTSAKEYFPTTDRLNVPRLDYTNSSCPSILVEPQRTNLVLRSEEFDNVSWVKVNTTITANAIISPDGTINADLCNYTAGSGSYINGGAIFAGNSDVVISVFVKANTISIFRIRESFYTGVSCVFDLSAQTAGTNGKIENYGNGWYRCSFKYNLSLGQTNINFIFDSNTATGSLYLWGAQAEVGSYATSYIPTVASSVTRNADVISKTGISSLIGQTEGTAFVDINLNLSFTESDMRFITISDGSSSNWYFIGTNNSNEIRFYFRAGATNYVSVTAVLSNGTHKLAFAYKNNDYVAYVDGVQIYTTSSLAVGSTTSFDLGKSFGSSSVSKQFINTAALWKTRLSNTELATLTTI
jgi:hypothetical protein